MSPKPNPYLRLQDIYIRQKLDNGLNIGSDDHMAQHALLDLMLQTNEKTIKDWVNKLEDFKKTKTVISQDLLRFEEKVAMFQQQKQKIISNIQSSKTQNSAEAFTVQQITTLLLDHGRCPPGDWKVMLSTKQIDRSEPTTLQKWKQNYPHKALGLFRLYDCFRKEQRKNQPVSVVSQQAHKDDFKLEEKVLSNDTVHQFLRQESANMFEQDYRAQLGKFMSSFKFDFQTLEFEDVFEPAIELLQEISSKKFVHQKVKVLLDALELARIARAYEVTDFSEEQLSQRQLTADERTYILQHVDLDELIFMNYVTVPP